MSSQVDTLFNGANKVPADVWIGTDPETAMKLYNVAEVHQTAIVSLVGQALVIIGKKEMTGERGKYWLYLYVPKQEPLILCKTSTSSKSFIERVDRAKLPVAGVVKTGKSKSGKGDYYIFE